jgi:Protein of unknown function (DUF3297)
MTNDTPALTTPATPVTPQVTPLPLPDRLSTDARSPHYVAAVFERDVGIRFNDKERFDVDEYCLSEGWIRVPAGKSVDRKGRPLLIKLKGRVEAFYR